MNNHYIRIDSQNNIIKGFSDAFEEALETDICIAEDGGRQFILLDMFNPSIMQGSIFKYKYIDGEVIEKTTEEIAAEESLLPPAPMSQLELQQQAIDTLSLQILSMMGV